MRSLAAVALLLALAVPVRAQSYRGVEMGQQDSRLPPQFDQVKWGEYDAQLGNDLMQVFVSGALVTGLRVTPRAPITLAEAVARHGSIPNIPSMLLLFDPLGQARGVVDPAQKIAYLTPSIDTDASVSEVDYFDQSTAVLLWLQSAPPGFLQELAEAANHVSVEALDARPQINSASGKAQFLANQATTEARARAKQAVELLKGYEQSCGHAPNCKNELRQLQQATEQLQGAVNRAEHVYQANYVGSSRQALDELEELSNKIAAAVRALAQLVQGQQTVSR